MRNRFAHAAHVIAAITLGWFVSNARAGADEILVKDGQTVAFMGDSITAGGVASPSGYVRLAISGLEANGVKAKFIPAGVSGHKSDQMLERLERDVLKKKPDWMTLSCGVNDVWHGEKGIPLDQYKKNITEIVDRCEAAGVKVLILTSTMITEDQTASNNQKLIAYNDFLRELAKEKKLPLADLNVDMQAVVKAAPADHKGNVLTVDGVHMNVAGNIMMATGVLKGFGLNHEQIEKAKAAWLDIPNACDLQVRAQMTIRQWQKLQAISAEKKQSAGDIVGAEVDKAVNELTKEQK